MNNERYLYQTKVTATNFDINRHSANLIASLHLDIRKQQELAGENKFEDILSSQAGLTDLSSYYIKSGGQLLVAETISKQAMTGFVGLKKISYNQVALKRLALPPKFRCQRIAAQLVTRAIDWAKTADYTSIILETSSKEEALSIYQKLGFKILSQTNQSADYPDYVLQLTF